MFLFLFLTFCLVKARFVRDFLHLSLFSLSLPLSRRNSSPLLMLFGSQGEEEEEEEEKVFLPPSSSSAALGVSDGCKKIQDRP